ncbi:MAG: HAD hydrolase-like protein [Pseudomonadota bacterium]
MAISKTLPPAIVAFDYDGVLADSLHVVVDYCVATLPDRPTCESIEERIRELENVTFEAFAERSGLTDFATFFDGLQKQLVARAGEVDLFAGIDEVVRRASERHTLHVVSASPVAVIERVLRQNDLRHCFADVLGGDSPGSKVDKLRRLATNEARSSVVMIGDSGSDIRAAREAGTLSVGVTWGWQSRARLIAARPDHLVDTPSELRVLLN